MTNIPVGELLASPIKPFSFIPRGMILFLS
jgi:hypothetical protein